MGENWIEMAFAALRNARRSRNPQLLGRIRKFQPCHAHDNEEKRECQPRVYYD